MYCCAAYCFSDSRPRRGQDPDSELATLYQKQVKPWLQLMDLTAKGNENKVLFSTEAKIKKRKTILKILIAFHSEEKAHSAIGDGLSN